MLDVGGATTDVHSVATESDQVARIMTAPEPKAKRTVEGDLGVYVNRMKVIESMGEEKLREKCEKAGIDPKQTLESYVAIPKNEEERKLVEILTEEAVMKAMERHAGQIRYVYGPSGRSSVAEGKDLTQVKYIVGTGGALTRLPHRVEIMKKIAGHDETGMRLFPTSHAEILVDNDYIMASLGVLSKRHTEGAKKLLEHSLRISFPEKKAGAAEMDQNGGEKMPAVFAQLNEELAEKDAKREELIRHIEECEAEGLDMTAYREDLGLPLPEKKPETCDHNCRACGRTSCRQRER